MVKTGLRTLHDTHLEVDTVVDDVHLDRLDAGEHVTIVVIVVAGGIIIFLQALLQQSLVVGVALLHAQHGIQIIGSNHRITYPSDVPDKILVTLIDTQEDIDMLIVVVPDGVFKDGRIAEAQLIVFLNQLLLGLLIALVGEFLRLEEVAELSGLVDLTEGTLAEERTFDLLIGELIVTRYKDIAHLHLVLLVDIDIEHHLTLVVGVVALDDINLRILKALLVEISLSEDLRTVDHVRRNLATLDDTQLRLHIVAL